MTWLRCSLAVLSVVALGSLQACSCNGNNPNGPENGCPGAGEEPCDGTCMNTQVDPNNCGACGNVCAGSQVCLSSGCATSCPAPLSACDRTCVDTSSDNANCGSCGNACPMGMGCVSGGCVPAVVVGPDPAKCMNGGDPTTVDPGTGMPTCTGNVVGVTFTYGMCACHDVGQPPLDSLFYIDAYNSNTGPYVPGGKGGSCGANNAISMTAEFHVTGDVRTSGPAGLTVGGAMDVGQSLHVANRLNVLDVLTVGMDAIIGSFAGDAPSTIRGDLFTPNCAAKPGLVTVNGTCTSGPIT